MTDREQSVEGRIAEIKGSVSGWRSAKASLNSRGYGFSLTNTDAEEAIVNQEWLLEWLEEALRDQPGWVEKILQENRRPTARVKAGCQVQCCFECGLKCES